MMKLNAARYILTGSLFVFLHSGNISGQSATPDSVIVFFTEKVNPDSIQAHMQTLENFGSRFCLAGNRKEVANRILEKYLSMGFENVQLDSFAFNRTYYGVNYQTWQYNIVCSYAGYRDSDSVYILGAHYDAIVPNPSNPFLNAPGADDNASGVAATIEIARIMKHYHYQPAYTIKFIAFAAEEFGLHGSWDYANKAYNSGMNIICMLNNDMVSYCTLPENQWKVSIQKYNNSNWFTTLAHTIINDYTILSAVESTQYIQYSDSWPFYQKGYNAIFFAENQFTPYYHTVNDLVATTNKFYAAEMTKISLGMLVYLNGIGSPQEIIPETLNVQDTTISPGLEACFSAQQTINVAGNGSSFIVQENALAQFIAGQSITFLPGTSVVNGGNLRAWITTDSTFCPQPVKLLTKSYIDPDQTKELLKYSDKPAFTVYPNPTSGPFTIEFPDEKEMSGFIVEVFNIQSLSIIQRQMNPVSSCLLNLSDNQPGVYFIRIYLKDEVWVEKIVKY